jgi:hypothetical protein
MSFPRKSKTPVEVKLAFGGGEFRLPIFPAISTSLFTPKILRSIRHKNVDMRSRFGYTITVPQSI